MKLPLMEVYKKKITKIHSFNHNANYNISARKFTTSDANTDLNINKNKQPEGQFQN